MRRQRAPRRGCLPRRLLLLVGLALLLLWAGGDLAFVAGGAETDEAQPADTILVLGCSICGGPPGGTRPCSQARADHAAALYRQGLAPWVIASGGGAAGERTEAEVLTAILVADGVPGAAVVAENQSHDTIQNILNSQRIMRERGW